MFIRHNHIRLTTLYTIYTALTRCTRRGRRPNARNLGVFVSFKLQGPRFSDVSLTNPSPPSSWFKRPGLGPHDVLPDCSTLCSVGISRCACVYTSSTHKRHRECNPEQFEHSTQFALVRNCLWSRLSALNRPRCSSYSTNVICELLEVESNGTRQVCRGAPTTADPHRNASTGRARTF